jgi:hypothetical protein
MPALVRVNGSFPQKRVRTLSFILCIRRSIFATRPQTPVVSSFIPYKLRCSLSFSMTSRRQSRITPKKRGLLLDFSTTLMYCIIPSQNYCLLNTMRMARKNCDWRKEISSDAVQSFELLYPTAGISDILPLGEIIGGRVLYVCTCLMAVLKENSK